MKLKSNQIKNNFESIDNDNDDDMQSKSKSNAFDKLLCKFVVFVENNCGG